MSTASSGYYPDHSPMYPHDMKRREEIRLANYERLMLKATRAAFRVGLSIRCARGDHGCLNNGSNCICVCHDR